MIKLSLDWRVCLLLLWSFHFITLLSILWLQADATPYWSETILGQMSQSFFFLWKPKTRRNIHCTNMTGGSSQSWLGIRKWMQSSTVRLGWQTQHPSLISLLFQVWTANMPMAQQSMTQSWMMIWEMTLERGSGTGQPSVKIRRKRTNTAQTKKER